MPRPGLTAPGYWSWLTRMCSVDCPQTARRRTRPAPGNFPARPEERAGDDPGQRLSQAQRKKPRAGTFRKISWKDSDGFDIKRFLGQVEKTSDPQNQTAVHYLLKLALSATDNNVETGPAPVATKSFTFRSFPRRNSGPRSAMEEVLSERLEKVYEKLKNVQINLDEHSPNFPAIPSN